MKKKPRNHALGDLFPIAKKILIKLKLTLCIVLLSVMGAMATSQYSQTTKISINLKKTSVKKVLENIETQSDFFFLYSEKFIDVAREVSIEVHESTIEKVLDKIFAGTNVSYTVKGRQVVLTTPESNQKGSSPSTQQQKSVSGKVTDSSGSSLPGVSVALKGSTTGTTTDVNGSYTLPNVPMNGTLQFSFIGMKSQEINIGGKTSINIQLQDEAIGLKEVVAVGYGTQKKADLTGSVSNISSEKLNTQSNSTIGQALQGKIAGVDIASQGGAPGGSTRIMIRGIGTLNNSSPLYVVDGIYMDNIDHINPNDIERIDVLKDASASAIYGSRAANGVVIVSTKKGSDTGGKPIVDISANLGVQTPSKYLDMLNASQWATVTTQARAAINLPQLEMASDLASKPDNDWQRIMMGPAVMQNYSISLHGGSKFFTYYTGVGYLNQDGTVKGTNFQRFSFQFKSDYKRGIFSAGNNIVFTDNSNIPLPGSSRGGLMGIILQSLPTLEKYDSNRIGGYGGSYGGVTNLPNPLGQMDRSIFNPTNNNVRAYINLYAQVEFIKGLKYKLNIAPDYGFARTTDYTGKYDFGLNTNSVTQLSDLRVNRKNILIENLLSFDQVIGDHKITALVGYSFQKNGYRSLTGSGQNLPAGLEELGAATTQLYASGNSSTSTLTSIISRLFYSYKNRYLVTATLRRDGSSRFAPQNRYGSFPSFSVGWNIAEENFMERFTWLNQLKVRGGYGVLGNQEIGDYQFASTITTGINYPDGNGGLIQGAFPKVFSSPNIKWESTTMTNFGIDLMALNNRMSIVAEYYIKNTKDILLNVPIPISSGGSNDPIRNAGSIQNKGFEFSISWNDRPNKDFSYGLNLIGSILKNTVTKMGTGTQAIWGGATNQNINTEKTLAGYPIGGFWLIPSNGYFQNLDEVSAYQKDGTPIQPTAKPGDVRFVDTNNDGKINDDDRVYMGSPFPKFTTSLNANFTYKGIDLMINWQGVFGNKIYNATRQTLEDVTKGTNFLASTLDFWTPENPNAAHPRLVWDDPNRNSRAESDRYLESGTYIRLRNIQIGYSLPARLFHNAIEKCRIYVNAENPFIITKYKGYSPDMNAGGSYATGFDNFTYPVNKVFMIGLNLTF